MNLDDYSKFSALDPQNMLAEIESLPGQLESAFQMGLGMELPMIKNIKNVIISGMGGSAIGADLLAAYVAGLCPLPVVVHRDYDLPAWASGPETLVIASSHSGNTEETLSSFQKAVERKCSLVAVCTGGKLEKAAREANVPVWKFSHAGQPRAAVGFSFGLLLAMFARLNLIPDPSDELADALKVMRAQHAAIRADSPVNANPAKRLAGQMVGRIVSVWGSGALAPVARRWKGQINELAKAWAQFEFLPEADHNMLAGDLYPEDALARVMVVFLNSKGDHARNQLRTRFTREGLMVDGINTDVYTAEGDTTLAQMWSAIHFGDYTAYYLAIAYGTDPTPVDALTSLKSALSKA